MDQETTLDGAVRAKSAFKKTDLPLPVGEHKGYFIGLGPTFREQSTDRCRVCAGVDVGACRACDGTGRKTTTKTSIRYQMGPNLVVEEFVTYAVTEPRVVDGQPRSASTLWLRMRRLSGLSDPTEIKEWYAGLARPIKIGIRMMVVGNDAGDRSVIAEIAPIVRQSAQPPATPEIVPASSLFDDGDLP